MKKEDKTFADISKDIKKKYDDRYDPISLNGLKTEMQRLRDMQEEVKAQQEQQVQMEQEQFFLGGLFGNSNGNGNGKGERITAQDPLFNFLGGLPETRGMSTVIPSVSKREAPSFDLNAFTKPFAPESMDDRTFSTSSSQKKQSAEQQEVYGRDPLMYASALGPLAALLMNKRTDPINRSEPGRFVSTGKAGVGTSNPRQTEFDQVSMSPIERALAERSRAFTGANAQASGGNTGQFLANELANQANILNAQGQASLGQQQMNTQIAGMNAQEQARIDAIKAQELARSQQAEQVNAQLALQYDQIDDMNEGAFLTNRSNAIQSIFQNLGSIGRENTQGNIILKALGYDEMGNYGGKGKNPFAFLDSIISKLSK